MTSTTPAVDGFGRTIEDYIDDCELEARRDAVAFGSIVTAGELQFKFSGSSLEQFVRRVARDLLHRGAKIAIQARPELGVDWCPSRTHVGLMPDESVEVLVHEWKTIDDGYGYFAWFTFRINSS